MCTCDVTNLENLIDEAEPCRHLAIVLGCTLEKRFSQASIRDVTGLVAPPVSRPGDEAEAAAEA